MSDRTGHVDPLIVVTPPGADCLVEARLRLEAGPSPNSPAFYGEQSCPSLVETINLGSMSLSPALRVHTRLPAALLLVASLICLATVWSPPAGRTSWFLEVGPGLLGIAVLVATYARLPLSHWVYVGVFVHLCILIYGGVYTYAETPLGNWARDAFGLSRNDYDRVGHLALGVFPCFTIREVLLRMTPLERGGWLYFLVNAVVLAVAAFWELCEWWVALMVSSDTGTAFLGTQGDVWDTQWDMLLALVGSLLALLVFRRQHDRSMARVPLE